MNFWNKIKALINCAVPLWIVFCYACFFVENSYAQEPSEVEAEAKLKAACIFNFAKYVKWPDSKFFSPSEKIKICLPEKHPFGNIFEGLKGKQVQGREVEATKISSPKNAFSQGCHILFVSDPTINLAELPQTGMLTVSDSEHGGMISFVTTEGKVKFNINLDRVRLAGLQISSQMLQLALSVTDSESKKESHL